MSVLLLNPEARDLCDVILTMCLVLFNKQHGKS